MEFSKFYPNYDEHPAYKDLPVNNTYNSDLLVQLVSQIDDGFNSIASIPFQNHKLLKEVFQKKILLFVTEIKKHTLAFSKRENTKKLLDFALRKVLVQMEFDLRYRNKTHQYENKTKNSLEILSNVRKNGAVQIKISDPYRETVLKQLEQYKSILIEKAKLNPNGRSSYSIHSSEKIWPLFREYLKFEGILDIISDYKQTEMELFYLALEYSHENQIWYKDGYIDAALPTPRTAYLHYDYDYDMIKAMVYINEANDENGAFKYVQGSHTWERSPFLFSLFRELDMESPKVIGYTNNGFYRNRITGSEHRKDLMDLPKIFRGTSHFGDDLIDNSSMSNLLLSKEVTFEGKPGDLIIFDGERGLHRGGLVAHGERFALQIGFKTGDLRTSEERFNEKLKHHFGQIPHKLKEILNFKN